MYTPFSSGYGALITRTPPRRPHFHPTDTRAAATVSDSLAACLARWQTWSGRSVLPSLGTVDSGSVHCWKCGGIGTGTATGTGNKLAAAELTGHSSAPTGLCLCLCANRRVCEFVSVTGSRFLRTLNGTRRCRLFLSFFFLLVWACMCLRTVRSSGIYADCFLFCF